MEYNFTPSPAIGNFLEGFSMDGNKCEELKILVFLLFNKYGSYDLFRFYLRLF